MSGLIPASSTTRTIFILASMPVSIGVIALCAFMPNLHGWVSGAAWSYGFALIYILYAIIVKDRLVGRFLFFGAAAGFAELGADNWLVNNTHTLFYPQPEPTLVASPAYMPFSWVVVLLQVGYIGYLIYKKHGTLIASVIVGVLGCMIIPFYEYLAINAGWWSYDNAPKWGIVPIYIFIAEGLLMVTIPDLFDRCDNAKLMKIPLFGIIQGLVMWLACIISFYGVNYAFKII